MHGHKTVLALHAKPVARRHFSLKPGSGRHTTGLEHVSWKNADSFLETLKYRGDGIRLTKQKMGSVHLLIIEFIQD